MKRISVILLTLSLSACGGNSTIMEEIEDTNTAPVADAGNDQSVTTGGDVYLDASNSYDTDGDELFYGWSIVDYPDNSIVVLDSYTTPDATFIVDMGGSYVFEVTVSDGEFSSTDEITITATEVTDTIGTGSTAGIECDYSYSEFNDTPSVNTTSTSEWTCSENTRDLVANGIPDHEVGTFPNPANPNTISEQTVTAIITLNPVETDVATTLGGPSGPQGYVLNGIKIDAGTGGSCTDYGNFCSGGDTSGAWSLEAINSAYDFGADENNAHVQPDGTYHYHGMPEGFIELQGGNSSTMTLVAWASDGFPIYARYGYSDPTDSSSEIQAMEGSYQFVTEISEARPSEEDYYMGSFQQDWEYVAGSGDLDECNGRFGVTPEFPNGIYHYFSTDSYPYFQRCVKGEVEGAGGPGGR